MDWGTIQILTLLTRWRESIPCGRRGSLPLQQQNSKLNARVSVANDVSPGLECIRNEHLLAMMLNPDRQVTPNAATLVNNLYDYANVIVKV